MLIFFLTPSYILFVTKVILIHLTVYDVKIQLTFNFVSQQNFPTLTRMLSYSEMTNAVKKIVSYFKWEVFGFFVYNFDDAGKGHSECSLVLSPFNRQLNNGSSVHETFENGTPALLKEKLNRLKEKSRSKLKGSESYGDISSYYQKKYLSCSINFRINSALNNSCFVSSLSNYNVR